MAAKAKNTGPKAGKRVVTTVEETVAEEQLGGELNLEPDAPDGDEGEDFLTVLGDLAGGSEARCEIRRTSPADFAGYCCTYPLSEMSLDRLQGEWGGGKFNVRVRNARGEFKGSTSIQIAGKPRHRDDSSAAPVAPAQSNDALAGVLAAIQASQKASQDAAAGQINLLTTLVTSLINKPVPEAPKGPDVLEVISQLAPILKPEKQSGGDPADAVKLLMQGIELGKDLAGGGGDDSMLGLAGKGLDMVKTLAASQPARRPVLPPPARRAPPRAPALAPPAQEPGSVPAQESAAPPAEAVEVINPQDPPMLKLLGWIKQQTQLLCYQAARGKDPQLYADLFLDNIPAGVSLETIHEQMSAPDALERLASINPAVRQHPEWMEKFRQAVLAGIGEEDEDDAGEADEGEIGEPTGDNAGGES